MGLQYDPSHLAWQMMDPIQCARDFVDKIYDVHLKDTEIMWPVLRKVGINPLKIIQGDAPGRARSMVMEWALQHQRELLEDWSRLGRAQSAQSIEPLV